MYVYILDFGDQIKIGQASNVGRRIHTIEMASGRKVVRPFSIEAIGEYERLMHKKLVDYRLTGEYFNYPYEEVVVLLQNLVKSQVIEKERDKNKELPLLPMDYFDRVQTLFTEKSRKENINITLRGFLESIQVNYDEFFKDRERKITLLGPVHTTWNQWTNRDNTQGKINKRGKHHIQLVIPPPYPPIPL